MKKLLLNCVGLIAFALLLSNHSATAQTANQYLFNAYNRTYTPVTGGTVVSNTATHDNQYFNSQNIGFTFQYLGTNYTQFGVSINGFITMGTGGSNSTSPISGQNLTISALGTDIASQAEAVLRVQTIGSAPNRICVIQWAGFRYVGQAGNYNFQIRLYENTNKIEFHYGSFSHVGTNRTAQVGIRGEGADFNNRTYGGTALWNESNTSAGTANNNNLRLRETVYPSTNLVFAYFPNRADVGVNIAVDNSTPCVGSEITYLISVASNGPANTTGVQVTAGVSGGITVVGSTPSKGAFNAGTGVWTVGTMEEFETATLEVRARINNGQGGNSITANAAISASAVSDPIAANNNASVVVNVLNNSIPTISSISDQSVGYNEASNPIPFTINDAETNANALVLSLRTSNPTAIPLSGLVLSGSGSNRFLTINPGLNQFGSSTVSIEVSDGTCSTETSFEVEVFKQSFVNFQAANIVIGQLNFETVSTTASQTIAPGSNSSAVSAKGVLALGSQTTNRVLLWNSVPTENGTPANVVVGQTNFTNTAANNTQSRLRAPDGVAFSPDGNKLIVADAGNNRILIWNTIPTSNGVNADVVVGQSNFIDNSAGTAANRLSRPTDVIVSPDGKMIVTDRNNHRVLIFNRIPTTNNASADVVIGQANFTATGGATSQNRLRSPWNTSIAPDGKLLIADDGNNRVLVFNQIPATNGANANVVIGQDNFVTMNPGSTSNRFNSPGVTVSPTGVIAVADFSNHRVSIFNQIPTTNGASADIVLGQRNFAENVAYNNGAGGTGSPSSRNMNQPYGINFDLNERLFVNGRAMNRMMVFGETPTQVADLALSFASNNGTPCVDGLVSYTVSVTNNGPNNATNVVVTSALPFGFTPVNAILDRGTYNQASGFWTIPFIGNGETINLEMQGRVNIGQNLNSITAYASVRSYNQFDSDFSNNSGNVTVVVEDNMAPTITSISDRILDFNTASGPIAFTVADTETAPAALTVSAVSSNTSIIPNANITFGGSGANRTINLNPLTDQFGTVVITVTVEDGRCSTSTEFTVSVGNVWLGGSTDWNLASNWSTEIPTTTISAFIPLNPVGGNYPIINTNANVLNFGIAPGARLTINATRNLNVLGNFYNDGSQNTGNGTVSMIGTSSQNIRGILGGLIINNPNGVVANGNLNVQGTLSLSAGTLQVGNNTLAIRNPIAGNSSLLNTVAGSSITIEGSTAGITLPAQVGILSQLTLNNGSGLSINNNLQVNSALNLSAGSLALNGHNLNIAGAVNTTAGQIAGNASSSINITGTGNAGSIRIAPAQNLFENFSISRTGANAQITIINEMRIANTLNLNGGRVISGNHFISLENTDPAALINHGPNSYIAGQFRRCVTEGNTYDFPVGSAVHYELARINFHQISAPTCIEAGFTGGHTGAGPIALQVNGNPVEGLLDYGFWTIKPTNLVSTITYSINLRMTGHTNGGPQSDYHTVVKRNNDASPWGIQGTYSNWMESGELNNPISISRSNLTGFSDFAIGMSSAGPLPVDLVYFKAEKKENHVLLLWQTASEENNDYFEIQKSQNMIDYQTIGVVTGKGSTSMVSNYRYEDYLENIGMVYYRLKQVDFDGSFEYSTISSLYFPLESLAIKIYPNPNQSGGNLRIFIPLEKPASVKVGFKNLLGMEIMNWQGDVQTLNFNQIQLPGNLAKGTYILSIQMESEQVHRKIIIE